MYCLDGLYFTYMSARHASRGYIVPGLQVAGIIIAALSLVGFVVAPMVSIQADMRIQPPSGQVLLGETFTVDIVVESQIPVNVFKGEVKFDPARLQVDSINYNTSIADLWAEVPWYENGEGTVNFAGGTTQKGGFSGAGSLIQITFRTIGTGDTSLYLEGARILEHNGLGTDLALEKPIDAIFAVEESVIASKTVANPPKTITELFVGTTPPSTDLNGDGKQSIADVSIFIRNMFGDDDRFDFNQDGKVDTKDLSILMSART